MTRLLLADNHRLARNGLRTLLEHQGFAVVAEADDGLEAATKARVVAFDVAVLDLWLPRMNGADCAVTILVHVPRASIIMLTRPDDDMLVAGLLALGIRGCVCKLQTIEDLADAIREVAEGGTYLTGAAARAAIENRTTDGRREHPRLTLRERQVLQLIAEGSTTKEVASALGVTTRTAESYRWDLMTKLAIHDVAGLVRYAIRSGLTGK